MKPTQLRKARENAGNQVSAGKRGQLSQRGKTRAIKSTRKNAGNQVNAGKRGQPSQRGKMRAIKSAWENAGNQVRVRKRGQSSPREKTRAIKSTRENAGNQVRAGKRGQPSQRGKTRATKSARKNAGNQVRIAFSSVCDWLKEWREFSRSIAERSNAKPLQSRIILDTIENFPNLKCSQSTLKVNSSCMRFFLEPNSEDYLFELRSSEPLTLTVTFEHPCTSSMASSKSTN